MHRVGGLVDYGSRLTFWRREKSLAATRNQTAEHPAHSLVTLLTKPSQLPAEACVGIQKNGHSHYYTISSALVSVSNLTI